MVSSGVVEYDAGGKWVPLAERDLREEAQGWRQKYEEVRTVLMLRGGKAWREYRDIWLKRKAELEEGDDQDAD